MKRIRDLGALKEDLRSHVDLVQYIGRHVTGGLEARGPNHFGLCPFHEESTGSFNVSPQKVGDDGVTRGLWSCFGCRENGDLFDFVQRVNNCNFAEALEIIAHDSGFDLTPYYRELSADEQRREDQYDYLAVLAQRFHENLVTSAQHLHFYAERGIEMETLAQFQIGYCPSVEWLLAVVGENAEWIEPIQSHREKLFNGHLLYPQFTPQGRIWGWYARQEPGVHPKYIGPSRAAALFEPGARLYGLAQARKLRRQSKLPMLIVEGFHDAMVSQQASIPTIAVCGTEFSDDQVKTLQSYAVTNAAVCFDDDEGGRAAMLRLAGRAHEINGVNLKFFRVPGEPSEFIVGSGTDAFIVRLLDAKCAVDFIVSDDENLDVSTPTKIRDFLEHIRPYLTNYPRNSVDRALGIKAVANRVGLTPSEVADFLEERQEYPLANPRAEIVLLAEFAHNPQSWVLYSGVVPEDFSLDKNRRTFALMLDCYQNGGEINTDLLLTAARNDREPQTVLETIESLPLIDRKNQETMLADMRDKSLRRNAQNLAAQAINSLNDMKVPAAETLANCITSVTSVLTGRTDKTVFTSVEAVTRAMQDLEDKSKRDGTIAGLDLGPDWSNLMRWTNGLRPGRVHVPCATSGVGKSVVGVSNWVWNLSIRDNGPKAAGLVASMEMDSTEQIHRIIAIDSGIPHYLVDRARWESIEQMDLAAATFEKVYDSTVTWMERQRTIGEIAMHARMLHANGKLDYIIIDYVQLLDLTSYNNKWSTHEKYGAASQEIVELAASLQVPVVAIAQLNRKAYEEDIPTGEQMGGAYKIYQDCHVCYTLSKRNQSITLGYLDKNRGGPDQKAVELGFDRDERRASLRVKELQVKGQVD